MRRFSPLPLVLFTVLAVLFVFTACKQLTPEEQVAAKRAKYTVELNSWYAQVENASMEEPIDEMGAGGEDGAAEGEDAAASDDADATAEQGMAEEMAEDMAMSGPQPHTIVFDLLVLYDGRGEPLSGLTVKVTQAASADPNAEEIDSWLQYLEMPSTMTKGVPEQIGFQLEGVPFEEGNVFAVSLVKNVPAEERSEYREFQEAGS